MFKVCQQGFDPAAGLFIEANVGATAASGSSNNSNTNGASSAAANAAPTSISAGGAANTANAALVGSIYPNPDAAALLGVSTAEVLERYRVLGMLVGRALYDGILLETNFAPFFRNLLLGRRNTVADVAGYDAALYRSFGELRQYAAEHPLTFEEDMGLVFAVTVERSVPDEISGGNGVHHHQQSSSQRAGGHHTATTEAVVVGRRRVRSVRAEVPLVPNGDRIPVTAATVDAYISLVADYYLNRTIQRYAEAFRGGLFASIEESWLRMFDAKEVQILFRGGDEEDVGLDVADWRANTTWNVQPELLRALEQQQQQGAHLDDDDDSAGTPRGGALPPPPRRSPTANAPLHIPSSGDAETVSAAVPFVRRVLDLFWDVVEKDLTPSQQRSLLQFATSMRRAPLLGFAHMTPRFNLTIVAGPTDRLPTAATCFCMLKLPCYSTRAIMRDRLVMAIEDATTFEMA